MQFGTNSYDGAYRREELINKISRSLEQLTLSELEALYYDMTTKNFIKDSL